MQYGIGQQQQGILMYFFKFNISDYLSHTSHLDELEDLAYRRMLDWYYLHEKPLPKSVDEIAKNIRMRTHCECIANVLREFFIETENGFENNRANSEIITYNEKSGKAKDSAKVRWDKNKNKNKHLPNDANALRTECEGNAKQETLNTKQETIPYQLIADAYNNKFAEHTNNPRIEKLTNARKLLTKKAWNYDIKNPKEKLRSNTIDYWERYFDYCATVPFFDSNQLREGDHKDWKPNYDFIMRESTHTKVREGSY